MYNQIKQAINIKQVAERNGVKIGNIKSFCPFHKEGKTPNLSFKGNMFKCFVCETKGDMFNLVAKLHNIGNYEAMKIIANQFGFLVDDGFKVPQRIKNNWVDEYSIMDKEHERLEIIYISLDRERIELMPKKFEDIPDRLIKINESMDILVKKIDDLENKMYNWRKKNG